MRPFNMLTLSIILMLFWGFGITLLSYAYEQIHPGIFDYSAFSSVAMNVSDIEQRIQSGLNKQLNIPIVDFGALVFYSGNLVADLFLNTLFAVPGILSLVISSALAMLSVDPFIATQIKIYSYAILMMGYILAVIAFLLSIRSGAGRVV